MRRFVQPLIATLLALAAIAAPASAAARHHRSHAPASVRLVQLPGGGTLIHVRGADQGRTVVRSSDAIAAVAVRDVDADGDLDIVASNSRGLVVWRNLGAGRYTRAEAPSTRPLHPHAAPGLAPSRASVQSFGLNEQRQHLAATRRALTTSVVPAVSPSSPAAPLVRSAACPTYAGRAPPVRG